MRYRHGITAWAILILSVLAVSAGAYTFSDSFDRPNSGDLGSDWATQVGSVRIQNNRALTDMGYYNYALLNGYSGDYRSTSVSVDAVDVAPGVKYVAMVFGIDANHSIFVKVQDNSYSGAYACTTAITEPEAVTSLRSTALFFSKRQDHRLCSGPRHCPPWDRHGFRRHIRSDL